MQLAKPLADPVEQRFYTAAIGDIDRVGEDGSVGLGGDFVELGQTAAGHDDRCALRSQAKRNRFAHAAAATDHDCILFRQSHRQKNTDATSG